MLKSGGIKQSPSTGSQQEVVQPSSSKRVSPFQSGDVFKGKVIDASPNGQVLLSAKGKVFWADLKLSLAKGGEHQFRVVSVGQRIVLRLLGVSTRSSQSPFQLWASGRGLRDRLSSILVELVAGHRLSGLTEGSKEALKQLHRMIPFLVYQGREKADAQWLSRCLLASGVFWENKVCRTLLKGADRLNPLAVNDLKCALLSLLRCLDGETVEKNQVEFLQRNLRQALNLIEGDQFLNLNSIGEGYGWYWFIPGSQGEGLRKAELLGRKCHDERLYHLWMILDLTNLGQMEVEVTFLRSCLDIRIYVSDAEKLQTVTNELPLLEKTLKARGLGLVQIQCHLKKHNDFIQCMLGGDGFSSMHLVI